MKSDSENLLAPATSTLSSNFNDTADTIGVSTPTSDKRSRPQKPKLEFPEVIIGTVVEFSEEGLPLVDFPGNPTSTPIPARTTASIYISDTNAEVTLVFVNADFRFPIITGKIKAPEPAERTISIEADEERIEFNAKQQLVLRCGHASITLTRAGKILLRGAYLLSRSSGVNRIKGGSVQIN